MGASWISRKGGNLRKEGGGYDPPYQLWQYLAKGSVSSKYRVESESKNTNVNDILSWLSIVRNVTPFKVFLTTYMHQFGWLSERGGQLFKFASERGGYPERGGGVGSLRKGGVPTLEETMFTYLGPLFFLIMIRFFSV